MARAEERSACVHVPGPVAHVSTYMSRAAMPNLPHDFFLNSPFTTRGLKISRSARCVPLTGPLSSEHCADWVSSGLVSPRLSSPAHHVNVELGATAVHAEARSARIEPHNLLLLMWGCGWAGFRERATPRCPSCPPGVCAPLPTRVHRGIGPDGDHNFRSLV